MFLKVSKTAAVTFEDRTNFRAFKLVVEGEPAQLDTVRRALAGKAEVTDADTAWIFQDALRQRPEIAGDAAWLEGFAAMIEKARPHGWIDDARAAIKAHVEWIAA